MSASFEDIFPILFFFYGKQLIWKVVTVVQDELSFSPGDHLIAPWIRLIRAIEFFHNSRLIRGIQQNKIYKKFRDFTRNWTQIACLLVRHLNYYTRMSSVLVWGYNWFLFMHGWFCPIRLIHLIGRKSFHFEKKIDYQQPSVKLNFRREMEPRRTPWVFLVQPAKTTLNITWQTWWTVNFNNLTFYD